MDDMETKTVFSRRSLLHRLGLAGAASTLLRSRAEAKTKKPVVLAMLGDRWHAFDYLRTAFYRTLVRELGLSVRFTPDPEEISRENLRNYRMLLILSDGMVFPDGYTTPYVFYDPKTMKIESDPPLPRLSEKHIMWITPDQGKAIREFVEKGGAGWFFHNASYISGANEDFRHVEGALFTGHTEFRPYKMQVVNHNHPITRGINDFVVTEEQHYLIYDKDPKDMLIRSVNEQGLTFKEQGATCEACWAYDYGKGRVCFMAPGHTIMSLWNPEYVKLQHNAAKWLLKET